jgi:hypothetical protein
MNIIEARVMAGAAFLDARIPAWAGKLDIDRLNIRDYKSCVLGQLYGGSYSRGADELGLSDTATIQLGFAVSGDDDDHDHETDESEYPLLTAEWKRVVTARCANA